MLPMPAAIPSHKLLLHDVIVTIVTIAIASVMKIFFIAVYPLR